MYWYTDNPRKTDRILRRVYRENDANTLIQIVREAPMEGVKLAALGRIRNWWELAEVLNAPVERNIKQQALRQIRPEEKFVDLLLCGHLTDSWVENEVLERIGSEEKIYSYVVSHSNLAAAAVKYIDDQTHLRHIVTDSRSARRQYAFDARKAALNKITDQKELGSVVRMGTFAGTSSEDRLLISEAAGRLLPGEDLEWLLSWYSDDAGIIKSVIDNTRDQAFLERTATSGKGQAKVLAAEKLRGREAFDEVFRNSTESIENRLKAAFMILNNYGDGGPLSELQKLGEETLNGHILYTTANISWERTEQICLRCGKTGGVEHDSESSRHYGCIFRTEPCKGFDPSSL